MIYQKVLTVHRAQSKSGTDILLTFLTNSVLKIFVKDRKVKLAQQGYPQTVASFIRLS